MQTSEQELMELLCEVFEQASLAPALNRENQGLHISKDSYFLRPDVAELGAPVFTLRALYGEQQNLLLKLAEVYRKNGREDCESVVREIERLLADPSIQLENTEEPLRRLLKWVYPVV